MLYCTPFLLFDGNCAEAMTFYQHVLDGKLTLTKTGDTPMKDQFPPEKHNKIINAHLKSGNIEFSATDWHADTLLPKQGNMFSIYVSGETYSELKIVFDKLAQNADRDERTFMDLHDMPFGTYGQLTDKYGVSWIFVSAKKEQEIIS
jgi:PhnB protein